MTCGSCGVINSVVDERCRNCGIRFASTQATVPINQPTNQIAERKRSYTPYIFLGLAIIYAVSPIDLVPDVPVVGWVDDIFLLAATGINVLENGFGVTNQTLKTILRLIKWIVIILGAIATAILAILGIVIYKLFFG